MEKPLYSAACATNEYADWPLYARVSVTPQWIDRVRTLAALCKANTLARVVVYEGPDAWDRGEALRLGGDELHVASDCF